MLGGTIYIYRERERERGGRESLCSMYGYADLGRPNLSHPQDWKPSGVSIAVQDHDLDAARPRCSQGLSYPRGISNTRAGAEVRAFSFRAPVEQIQVQPWAAARPEGNLFPGVFVVRTGYMAISPFLNIPAPDQSIA